MMQSSLEHIQRKKQGRALYFRSILGSLLGSILTLTTLILLNQDIEKKEEAETSVTRFNIANIQKKKKTQKKKKVKKKSRAKKKSLKPRMTQNLGLGEGGISAFGLLDSASFSEMKDVEMTSSTVDTKPRVISRGELVYPEWALEQKIKGFVKFKVLVGNNGSVLKTKIIESTPREVFDLVAVNSIKNWRFSPATYQGEKVKVWITQKIVFSLD